VQLYRPGNVVAERYEIKEVLGQGQVGATYLAFDKELEADVALKILAAELLSADAMRDFDAIFEKVSNFSHPNLRKVYEYQTQAQGSLALYTGVYHQGESLRQMLQSRKVFTHLEAEPILSQICQALSAAEKICAHGALRPENILVLPDTVKVTDLGLATALGSTYIATLRKGGASRYLAPELKAGGATTSRADVYSLGVLFSEMLSGEPYDGSPISFSAKNSSLPPSLDDVAKVALAANPAERYANANEFAEDLASVIDTGKIKPRAMPSSGNAIPSITSLPVVVPVAVPVAASPEIVSDIEEHPPLSVSDDAIELSVIATPKVAEVSRIETVVPPPPKRNRR
jgi:serine/threonine protein kinase